MTFARSGLTVRWPRTQASLLELAEACDVPTRWSCRSGVCHTCVTPLLAGKPPTRPIRWNSRNPARCSSAAPGRTATSYWIFSELAPIRVNAVSPGTIDTGAYDALGEEKKAALFAQRSASNPARRIGTPDDIAEAVVFALTNTFLTGNSIGIDGGEPLV